MQDITLILLAAGNSTRFGLPSKKQWLYQGDKPLWLNATDNFKENFDFSKIIIVSSPKETEYMKQFADFCFIAGGASRQESLKNAMKAVDTEYVLVNDIARCCIDVKMINRIIKNKKELRA